MVLLMNPRLFRTLSEIIISINSRLVTIKTKINRYCYWDWYKASDSNSAAIRCLSISPASCKPVPTQMNSHRAICAAYEWHWLIHCTETSHYHMLSLACPPCFSVHLPSPIHSSYLSTTALTPSFSSSLLIIFLTKAYCCHCLRAQTTACVCRGRAHARAHLLSQCEAVLRRQAWVERPLGSGSRYCRNERWSILEHCSSTEHWVAVRQ